MIGENERERTWNQSGDSVRLNVHRVAESEFEIRQQLATIRIEHDVLRRTEERNDRREPHDRLQVVISAAIDPRTTIDTSKQTCVASIQPRRRPSSGS